MEYVFPVVFLTLVAVLIMCVVLICYFEFLKPQMHEPYEPHHGNNGAVYGQGNVTHQDNDFQLDTLRNIDNTDFITNLTECDADFRNTCTVHDTNENNTDSTKHNIDASNHNACNTDSNYCITICHNSNCQTGIQHCDTGSTSHDIAASNYDSCITNDCGTANCDTGMTYDSGTTTCDTGTTNYDSSTTNCDCSASYDNE